MSPYPACCGDSTVFGFSFPGPVESRAADTGEPGNSARSRFFRPDLGREALLRTARLPLRQKRVGEWLTARLHARLKAFTVSDRTITQALT